MPLPIFIYHPSNTTGYTMHAQTTRLAATRQHQTTPHHPLACQHAGKREQNDQHTCSLTSAAPRQYEATITFLFACSPPRFHAPSDASHSILAFQSLPRACIKHLRRVSKYRVTTPP